MGSLTSAAMGITRDGLSKRRATGGKHTKMRKKRKFLLGRPAAMTRIGAKRVHIVKGRGGNIKHRAIRLDHGSFSWGSEAISRPARIIEVVYNASSNELVRTNTLVKGCVVAVEAAPFIDWYKGYYGVSLGKGGDSAPAADTAKDSGKAKPVAAKKDTDVTDAVRADRAKDQVIDPQVAEQLKAGRVLAKVSSRPGQTGVCDGYILEGDELHFYKRKLQKKK